mmetsp:Transcript_2741/g.7568  ORF Transcript_2741/g.7568 Transcript_2741/m.7568 type:complete len:98 (+) Transcript_2741:106-399(+)
MEGFLSGVAGFSAVCLANKISSRPSLRHPWLHAASFVGFWYLGSKMSYYRTAVKLEKEQLEVQKGLKAPAKHVPWDTNFLSKPAKPVPPAPRKGEIV